MGKHVAAKSAAVAPVGRPRSSRTRSVSSIVGVAMIVVALGISGFAAALFVQASANDADAAAADAAARAHRDEAARLELQNPQGPLMVCFERMAKLADGLTSIDLEVMDALNDAVAAANRGSTSEARRIVEERARPALEQARAVPEDFRKFGDELGACLDTYMGTPGTDPGEAA